MGPDAGSEVLADFAVIGFPYADDAAGFAARGVDADPDPIFDDPEHGPAVLAIVKPEVEDFDPVRIGHDLDGKGERYAVLGDVRGVLGGVESDPHGNDNTAMPYYVQEIITAMPYNFECLNEKEDLG